VKIISEDSLAVVKPEWFIKGQTSCWRDQVWFLEPSELSAVLISPLSDVFVDVKGRVSKSFSIVLVKTYTLKLGIFGNTWNHG